MDKQIRITVVPDFKKNLVKELKPGHLEIRLKAKPERNEANIALREILAEYYQVPTSVIQILTGRRSRNKLVQINSQPPALIH